MVNNRKRRFLTADILVGAMPCARLFVWSLPIWATTRDCPYKFFDGNKYFKTIHYL